jgi:hypothetical protein
MASKDKGATQKGASDVSFMIKAMQQQFEHMNTRFNDRERMEEQANTIVELQRRHGEYEAPKARRQLRCAYDHEDDVEDDEFDDQTNVVRIVNNRRDRREFGRQDTYDHNLGSIKMTIPPFQGKNDLDVYLEWEKKVELVFDCHNYSEEKKSKACCS